MELKVTVGEYQVPMEDFVKAVIANTRGGVSFDIRGRGYRVRFETSETRHGFVVKRTLKGMERGRGLYFKYPK